MKRVWIVTIGCRTEKKRSWDIAGTREPSSIEFLPRAPNKNCCSRIIHDSEGERRRKKRYMERICVVRLVNVRRACNRLYLTNRSDGVLCEEKSLRDVLFIELSLVVSACRIKKFFFFFWETGDLLLTSSFSRAKMTTNNLLRVVINFEID